MEAPISDQINAKIKQLEDGTLLTELEAKVFEMIKKACIAFQPKLVIARVAGGWVRDKLLGLESDDFDFTLDGASGREFGSKLQELYPETSMNKSQNQESVHLEVAKVKIFKDFWIDICSLRAEEYSMDSRIPVIRPGTIKEDSERRDFTLNALFFNVNDSKVEDFVGGISDLISGILKTPIDPNLSFTQDPLRILRAIRFSTRFNFQIDPHLLEAMKISPQLYSTKVSRERAELELSKIFKGKDPTKAIQFIQNSGLFKVIFDPENQFNLDENEVLLRLNAISSHFSTDANEKYAQVLSAVYLPIGTEALISDPQLPKKKMFLLDYAVLKIFKANQKIAKLVYSSVGSLNLISQLYSKVKDNNELSKVDVAHWIRAIGQNWKMGVLIAYDNDLIQFIDSTLLPIVEQNSLETVWQLKPLVPANILAKIHGIKLDKTISQYIEKLIDWQIENPEGTIDDYKLFVNSSK